MKLFNNDRPTSAGKDQQHSPLQSASNTQPLSENRGTESKQKENMRDSGQRGRKPNEKFKDDEYVIRPRVRNHGKDSNPKKVAK